MATDLAKLERGKNALAPADDVIAENGRNDEKRSPAPAAGVGSGQRLWAFSETAGRECGFSHRAKKQLFLKMWQVYKAQNNESLTACVHALTKSARFVNSLM
jgi:hypothetical protein